MDILSVFHILLGMAEKAISAPPNFDEMIESIYDAIAEKRAALLKDIRLSKREFVEDLNIPGSESQRRQNTILLLFLAYLLAMEEYFQIYQAVMEQKKAYAAAMQYIIESMEIMAHSRKNWEQGMLDDEQIRMIKLMDQYQKQLDELRTRMDALNKKHSEISSKLLSTANTINNITMEKTEKIITVLSQSSQKQIDVYNKLTADLTNVLNENIKLRNQAQEQLARSDLTGQQREELSAKVNEYTERIDRIEQAKELLEKQSSEKMAQQQFYKDKIDEAREKMIDAMASGDPKAQVDASLEMQLITDKLIVDENKQLDKMNDIFDQVKGLSIDNASVLEKVDQAKLDIASNKEALAEVLEFGNNQLTSAFSEFETLFGQHKDTEQKLESVVKETGQLQHKVKELRIEVKNYDRNNKNEPPKPSSNDSHPHP